MTENPYRPSQNAEPARAWDEGYRAALADLAHAAGENPYSRRGAWSPISFVAWRDGAACGVAAERARKLSDDALERAVAHYDEWCGYGAARRGALAAAIAAALSSPAEPGTGEDA